MNLIRLVKPVCIGALALLSGCASDPPTQFFALRAQAEPVTAAMPEELVNDSFGVGPVRISAPLAKTGIVSFQSNNQLVISAYNIWAANLPESIAEVIVEDFTAMTGNPRIQPHPWDSRTRPSRQLRLYIERFDGQLGGEVTLRCKWSLLEERGKREVATGLIGLSGHTGEPGYPAYVATMNNLLTRLSEQLFEAISLHM